MNKLLKKIFQVALISISLAGLTGCFNFGGSNTNNQKTAVDERSRIYENTEFSVKIPKEWDIIEKKDFTQEVPQETQVVFRNNVKNEDFTANVNIVRNTLQNSKETLEYAKEIINRQKTGLYDYKELKKDLVKISISGKDFDSYLVEFEARRDPSENITKFIQTFGVKGGNGYVIMGGVSLKENSNTVSTVEGIVKSFIVK